MAALDPKLAALLAAANGKRRVRLLLPADIEQAIADAVADPHGIAVRHGGKEVLGKTTLVLAVKPPKRTGVVVGIVDCWADRPTPGRVWKELGPWQQDFARNADKAHAWAGKPKADRVTVTAAKQPKRTAPTGDGPKLLAQIIANPADDHARLVYADHLTEQGDPRGAYITAVLALPKAKGAAAKRALSTQITALEKKHRREWTKNAMQDAREVELRRGFVARVTMKGVAWGAKGARLFDHDPIEELHVWGGNSVALAAVAGAAHTARLRWLLAGLISLESPREVAAFAAFLASPHVGKVPELELVVTHEYSPDLDPWTTGKPLPAVKQLVLHTRPKTKLAWVKQRFPNATIKLKNF